MKKTSLFFLSFIIIQLHAFTSKRDVATFISPRSSSNNAARELAGWENIVNIYTSENSYSAFNITPEATLTFRPERIAQCLLGDDIVKCKCIFTVSGSRQNDRTKTDWLADYFGLPTDYKSLVQVTPSAMQGLLDLNWFTGWDKYIPGLYCRIHAPLVYTRWNLNTCETLVTTGSHSYDPGYFNPDGVPRIQLVDNFTSFISGNDAPKAANLTFNKLQRAKMSCHALSLCKLSDISIALGYNVFHNSNYHLGGNIRFIIPTGNRPKGEFLFEPIIGNGHHWELGGGLSAHIVLWDDSDTQEKAALYVDLNITHMFETRQQRSFDLNCSANSRYMLAHKMGKPISDNLRGLVDGLQVEPTSQYQQEVSSVANLTTLAIDVSCNVQADLAIMIAYTQARNSWTFGYNLWGRSCDAIKLCGQTAFDTNSWALKGDAHLFGFENDIEQTAVALSATQSNATINGGTNFAITGASTPDEVATGIANPGIDNPTLAIADSDDNGIFVNLVDTPGGSTQIRTSIQPIILTTNDINIESGRTRGFSQKIFSSFTHIVPRKEISPHLGFGAEIEFGQSSECKQVTRIKEKQCVNTALSYWGIWIKTGISF